MIIKGTDKIKGVVDLASVSLQLTQKSVFSISDNDYWNSDVQAAIRLGYISAAGEPNAKKETTEDKIVRCTNSYHRTINLSILDKEIGPGHGFTLKESQLSNSDVKVAIAKGMIKICQIVDPSDHTEGFLKLGDLFQEQESEQQPAKKEEVAIFKQQRQQKLADIIEQKKKEHKSQTSILETNEEVGRPLVIDEDNPPEVDPQKVGKPNRGITWNPSGVNPVHSTKGSVVATDQGFSKTGQGRSGSLKEALCTSADGESTSDSTEIVNAEVVKIESKEGEESTKGAIKTHVVDSAHPAPVDPTQDDPRRHTVVVNPHGIKVGNTIKDAVVWTGKKASEKSDQRDDLITFIDEEEDRKRFKAHPVLREGEFPEEEEVSPLAEDDDAARIAKHPILGKQERSQNEEIDFVG